MKKEDIQNLRIGVIGGGFAGATAGLALSQIGAQVKVYEQAQVSGEVGAGIGLRPATVKLFKKLGVFAAIEKVTSPSDYFEILDANGTVLNREVWPHLEEDGEKHNTRMIHRRDFVDALHPELPEGYSSWGTVPRPSPTTATPSPSNSATGSKKPSTFWSVPTASNQRSAPCGRTPSRSPPTPTPTEPSSTVNSGKGCWSTTTCGCTSIPRPTA